MNRWLLFPLFTAGLCSGAFVACSDEAAPIAAPGPDAAAVDAQSSLPPAAKGDDDIDIGGDDDDIVTPEKDAGSTDEKDAAISDADKPDTAPPPPPVIRRVFVTKAKFNGDLRTAGGGVNGLDGADKLCAQAAVDAKLGGDRRWVAWVSSDAKSALERLQDASPWYLVNKTTLVFPTKEAVSTTAPLHAIDMNETGTTSIAGTTPLLNLVWTGTYPTGVGVNDKDCAGWTSASGSGVVGTRRDTAANGTRDWSRYRLDPTESCAKPWPLYCFEQ